MPQFRLALSVGPVDFVHAVDGVAVGPERHGAALVVIAAHQAKLEELDTWLHETLHVLGPTMTEATVARVAKDLAAVLWHAGYRLTRKRRRKGKRRSG